MIRPPRVFRIGTKRLVFIDGEPKYIKSELPDPELVESVLGLGVEDDENSDTDSIDDEDEPENYDPLSHRGLYDDEIRFIAEKLELPEHGYLGTFPIDKIHTIAKIVKPGIEKFGFIFNTDPSDKPGKHWIAVAYSADHKELDYYNSLGEGPTDQFLDEIKPVIDALRLPYYLKFKINTIPRQGASFNCGYHALLFLYKILVEGMSYKFASGYSEIKKGEKEISTFKDKLEKFGYI